jgi:hypothetical protein
MKDNLKLVMYAVLGSVLIGSLIGICAGSGVLVLRFLGVE